jgi:predicted dinucleotide-binding enzyme
MRVGVLGSGDVGKALAKGFKAEGHDVCVASREPLKKPDLSAWASENEIQIDTFDKVAAYGELLVVCTLWAGTENAIQLSGTDNFTDKVVIDTTNPLDLSQKPPGLLLGKDDSAGEQVQRWLPNARVVKAFNSVGSALMYKPQLPGGPPTMFIAGNDTEAKQTVSDVIKSFGWEVADNGGIEGSRELEALCILWVRHAITFLPSLQSKRRIA